MADYVKTNVMVSDGSRVLELLKFMRRETDEEHYVTMEEISVRRNLKIKTFI